MIPIIQSILGGFESPMKVGILVIGKVGVGKSTLINGLVGKNVSKTGSNVSSTTKDVSTYKKQDVEKDGIIISIIDTPGFGDLDMEDEDTLQNAIHEGGQIDLVLFCLKINEQLDKQAITEIKTITHVLGEDVWKKAVLVLTFANELKFNTPDKEKEFKDKLNEWERELKKRMKKIIDPEIVEKIPFVPAGYKEPQLPDRPSWISEFWIQGFRRMGFKAMVKFVLVNQHRIHNSENNMKLSQDMYGNPEDQPLITCYMSKEKRWVSPHNVRVTSQIIGLVIGGVATISSGSIPYFYTGMSLGLGLGNVTADLIIHFVGIADEKPNGDVNDCYKDAISNSLIAAFNEEYPEYRLSSEPPKDEPPKAKDEL